MRIAGKVALITGAARGMGAAEARLFAREGARVAITDVLEEQGRALEAEITDSGGDAFFLPLDVAREDDWKGAMATVRERLGGLDVLVNNAAIYRRGKVEQITADGWDNLMGINARGVFLGIKHAIPLMREAGGGSIVNISSTAGINGSVLAAAYGASKGAVRLLTKATAIQYAADGIRANSVHPGPIDTEMMDEVYTDDELPGLMAKIPMGRFGLASEVAAGVLYLASDESAYVTGSELVIDGGWTAQ